MSNLIFEREHALGLAGAREAMQRVADDMVNNYQTACQWEGNVLSFRRSGVRGTVTVTDTQIQLDAKLGVLLAAFKPRIEETLHENFEKYFS